MAISYSGTNCPAVIAGNTVTYTYDAISRLTNETIPNYSNTSWIYDWVGNRGNSSDYNEVDEYKAGNGYVYDKLGNLIYKPDQQNWAVQYTYRGDNLLGDVYYIDENNGISWIGLTWDGDGHRVEVNKDFADDSFFTYDPTAGIPAVLFVQHYGETGPEDYTYNVREPGGALLASFEPEGANIHYYHFDGLGSTLLVTNGSGTVSDSHAYDAWGNVTPGVNNSTTDNPYQYVGQLGYYSHHQESTFELMQLGVRFYDSGIGRFTQKDSISNERLSSYIYADDNPSSLYDPSGLEACERGDVTGLKWVGKSKGESKDCAGAGSKIKKFHVDTCLNKKVKNCKKYSTDMEITVTLSIPEMTWSGINWKTITCTMKGKFNGEQCDVCTTKPKGVRHGASRHSKVM
jgi:RHS repeat-associated protein